MDPNETLRQLREKMQGNFIESETRELFEALDEWLAKGGFLPKEWNREVPMIVVGQFPATELMHALRSAEKGGGIRKMRVKVEGEQVKFKVNEMIWSPPYGEIQEPY
jgi:hypothetical protein